MKAISKFFLMLIITLNYFTAVFGQSNPNQAQRGSAWQTISTIKVYATITSYESNKTTPKILGKVPFFIGSKFRFTIDSVLKDNTGAIKGYIFRPFDWRNETPTLKDSLMYYRDSLKTISSKFQKTSNFKISRYKISRRDDEEINSLNKFLNFTATDSVYVLLRPYLQYKYLDGDWINNREFFMTASDFAECCESLFTSNKFFHNFTYGFTTIPYKIRFDNSRYIDQFNQKVRGTFSFEQNVNIGVSVGFKSQVLSHDDISWISLFGVSLSSVPIVVDPAKNSPSSTQALSFSFGEVYQYKVFQIGLFLGTDVASSQAYLSPYSGFHPWLGIGLGISLFNVNKTSAGDSESNTNSKQ